MFYSVTSGCLSVSNMYLPNNWGLIHHLPMIWKGYMFHPFSFVFLVANFISCCFSVLISIVLVLWIFQNLLSIQDHFYLASVILMCQLVNMLPMIPFWWGWINNVYLKFIVSVFCSKSLWLATSDHFWPCLRVFNQWVASNLGWLTSNTWHF